MNFLAFGSKYKGDFFDESVCYQHKQNGVLQNDIVNIVCSFTWLSNSLIQLGFLKFLWYNTYYGQQSHVIQQSQNRQNPLIKKQWPFYIILTRVLRNNISEYWYIINIFYKWITNNDEWINYVKMSLFSYNSITVYSNIYVSFQFFEVI